MPPSIFSSKWKCEIFFISAILRNDHSVIIWWTDRNIAVHLELFFLVFLVPFFPSPIHVLICISLFDGFNSWHLIRWILGVSSSFYILAMNCVCCNEYNNAILNWCHDSDNAVYLIMICSCLGIKWYCMLWAWLVPLNSWSSPFHQNSLDLDSYHKIQLHNAIVFFFTSLWEDISVHDY